MTYEEAAKILEYPILKWAMEWDNEELFFEAIEKAIDALKKMSDREGIK